MSDNFKTARFSFIHMVANIFFFTRKEGRSKWGSSSASGSESAILLNVSKSTMGANIRI